MLLAEVLLTRYRAEYFISVNAVCMRNHAAGFGHQIQYSLRRGVALSDNPAFLELPDIQPATACFWELFRPVATRSTPNREAAFTKVVLGC